MCRSLSGHLAILLNTGTSFLVAVQLFLIKTCRCQGPFQGSEEGGSLQNSNTARLLVQSFYSVRGTAHFRRGQVVGPLSAFYFGSMTPVLLKCYKCLHVEHLLSLLMLNRITLYLSLSLILSGLQSKTCSTL